MEKVNLINTMKELNRLEQIINESLVANKRTHVEAQHLIEMIKSQLTDKENGRS